MQNTIIRFFVMTKMGLTVTDSQVFGWMNLLNKRGYSTSIISFIKKIDSTINKNSFRENIGGDYFQYQNKLAFFNDMFSFITFLNHYIQSRKKAKKIIFQTRTSGVAFSLIALKLFTNAKIIYDARGAAIEESTHINQGKSLGLKKEYKFRLLKLKESWLIKYSNHVFCVSNTLKAYYLEKYRKVNPEKLTVVPCAADSDDFYFNNSERQSMRKEFNLIDKKVLLYSGRLDKSWDIPEDIFKFYIELSSYIDNLILFILSPDKEIANKLIKKFNLNQNNVIVKTDSYQNVRKYLNMVDYGLLLREDAVMNHVSSPTKFAEYLLCGLPVFMSDTVYDFSKLINDSGYGLVVEDFHLKEQNKEQIKRMSEINRPTISEWAQKHLSKDNFIDSIIKAFQDA